MADFDVILLIQDALTQTLPDSYQDEDVVAAVRKALGI